MATPDPARSAALVAAESGTYAEAEIEGTLRRLRRMRAVSNAYVSDVRSDEDPNPIYKEGDDDA